MSLLRFLLPFLAFLFATIRVTPRVYVPGLVFPYRLFLHLPPDSFLQRPLAPWSECHPPAEPCYFDAQDAGRQVPADGNGQFDTVGLLAPMYIIVIA